MRRLLQKDIKEKGERRDKPKRENEQERVKIEVCLSEEGKEKGEEQWIDVWEEDIKEGTGAWDFQVAVDTRSRTKEETKSKEIKDLIKDFPNLKVRGLLPDPVTNKEWITIKETMEWTVVVFPRECSPWKKVV